MDRFHIEVDTQCTVSALLLSPPKPAACFVFAHGAGAGMTHPFMDGGRKAVVRLLKCPTLISRFANLLKTSCSP